MMIFGIQEKVDKGEKKTYEKYLDLSVAYRTKIGE